MKKVIIAVIASLVLPISVANANGIQSPLGISHADWHASSDFKNFQCPQGTSRSEGINLNFTTDESDDFLFVECYPTPIWVNPILNTPSDTATVTTPAPQPVQQLTPTPAPSPVITDTSTASTAPSITTVVTDTATVVIETSILDEELDLTWDWEKVIAWIVAWLEKWWIKL
jgi:hypothetical protein